MQILRTLIPLMRCFLPSVGAECTYAHTDGGMVTKRQSTSAKCEMRQSNTATQQHSNTAMLCTRRPELFANFHFNSHSGPLNTRDPATSLKYGILPSPRCYVTFLRQFPFNEAEDYKLHAACDTVHTECARKNARKCENYYAILCVAIIISSYQRHFHWWQQHK